MKTFLLVGSPGAGKTVMVARLYAYLLMNHKRVIHQQETVSLLIRKGKVTEAKHINQKRLVREHLKKQKELEKVGLTDFYLSEDTPLGCRLYAPDSYTEEEYIELFKKFEPCIFVKVNFNIYPETYDNSTRIHTYEESIKLDKELDIILDKYSLKYIKVDRNTPLQDIISYAI